MCYEISSLVFCKDKILKAKVYECSVCTYKPLIDLQKTDEDNILLTLFNYEVAIELGTTLSDILISLSPWSVQISKIFNINFPAYINFCLEEVNKYSEKFKLDYLLISKSMEISDGKICSIVDMCGKSKKEEKTNYSLLLPFCEIKGVQVFLKNNLTIYNFEDQRENKSFEYNFTLYDLLNGLSFGLFDYAPITEENYKKFSYYVKQAQKSIEEVGGVSLTSLDELLEFEETDNFIEIEKAIK